MKRRSHLTSRQLMVLAGFALALSSAACDAGVSGRSGLGSLLRVTGGTPVDGTLSSATDPTLTDGPTVTLDQFHSLAYPGAINRGLAGSVQSGATSIAIGFADDNIYWYVAVNGMGSDIGASSNRLFSATLSYSPDIASGSHNLVLRAILPDGRMGPALIQPIMISPFDDIKGTLEVRLTWKGKADLDLHVVVPVAPPSPPDPMAPNSVEVWVNNPLALPPRPSFNPYTADDAAAAGVLSFDSNAGCVIDGRDQENVIWGGPPPSGMYTVRVDAVSMCGDAGDQWQVAVFQNANPVPVYAALGEAVDSDTRFSHTTGSGVLALQFQIP